MSFHFLDFSRKPVLTRQALEMLFQDYISKKTAADGMDALARRTLEELRQRAAESGLTRELAALETPEPFTRRDEVMQRVRVIETSFSTEYEGLPYFGAATEILDVPAPLGKRLERGGVVELVSADVPLHRVPIHVPIQR